MITLSKSVNHGQVLGLVESYVSLDLSTLWQMCEYSVASSTSGHESQALGAGQAGHGSNTHQYTYGMGLGVGQAELSHRIYGCVQELNVMQDRQGAATAHAGTYKNWGVCVWVACGVTVCSPD